MNQRTFYHLLVVGLFTLCIFQAISLIKLQGEKYAEEERAGRLQVKIDYLQQLDIAKRREFNVLRGQLARQRLENRMLRRGSFVRRADGTNN